MSRTRELHPLKILASVGAALLVWGLLFAYASSPAQAATITVNSLADDADPNDGECTLREAITAANTDTASGAADAECAAGSGDDVIHFALPGTTPWTVNLTGELPELTTNIELARIIHERSVGLHFAYIKTDEYAGKVAYSLHYQLEALKIEFPLFINKTRLRE
jgi:CSLREA domain-containing protein